MATWQVQQAKARLSQVIDDAQTKGPQVITKHGAESAVVLSIAEYKALKHPTPQVDFRDFLLSGPRFLSDEEHEEFFGNLRDPNDSGRNLDYLFDTHEHKEG
jgi:antitoxin Phd